MVRNGYRVVATSGRGQGGGGVRGGRTCRLASARTSPEGDESGNLPHHRYRTTWMSMPIFNRAHVRSAT